MQNLSLSHRDKVVVCGEPSEIAKESVQFSEICHKFSMQFI